MNKLTVAALLCCLCAGLAFAGDAIHKTLRNPSTGELLERHSADPSSLDAQWGPGAYLYNPDLSGVAGVPKKYRKAHATENRLVEMGAGGKAQIDAALADTTATSLRSRVMSLSIEIAGVENAIAWLVANGKSTVKAQATLDALNADRDALLPQLP